jgi:hypothetical protein
MTVNKQQQRQYKREKRKLGYKSPLCLSQKIALATGKKDCTKTIYRNLKVLIQMYENNPKRLERLIKLDK